MIAVLPTLCAAMATAIVVRAARRAGPAARVRRLRSRAPRVPAAFGQPLAAALDRAAVPWPVESALTGWGLTIVVAATATAAVAPPLVAMAVIAAVVGPPAALFAARGRADRRAAAALPAAVRAIAGELRAGGTVPSAVARLASQPSPLQRDLARVDARRRLGAGLATALAPWSAERPVAGVRTVAGALVVTAELGGASADALEGLAASLADREAITAETRAQSAQARVSALVVGAAPLGYLALSAVIDGDAVAALVATLPGRVCLGLGLLLDGLALVWMRWLVRDPEAAW